MDARRVEGSRWPPGHSAQPTVSYIPSNSGGEGNTVQPRWRWGLGSRGPMPDLQEIIWQQATLVIVVISVLGIPFSWHKTRGGFAME